MAEILRSSAPADYDESRMNDAIADVIHRSLFGLDAAVNVHPAPSRRPPFLAFDPIMRRSFSREPASELTVAGQRTQARLLDAGREVFARRGYFPSRVDDIVREAGVSHGAFYRYFDNKEHLARVLTAGAMQHRGVGARRDSGRCAARRSVRPGTAPLAAALQHHAGR